MICIRGCVTPCQCSQCWDQPIHEPDPRPAENGLLCRRDRDRLEHMLREIPDLYATLDSRLESITTDNDRVKRGKLSGSPALARLDVIAMQDPRTMPATGTPDQWGYTQADDDIWDVAGVMIQWSDCLADEHDIEHRATDINQAVHMLLGWFDQVCHSTWIDEFFREVKIIRRQLGRAHGERKPRPVGKCINVLDRGDHTIECGANLYLPVAGATIRCRDCGRRYDGADLIRLEILKRERTG